MRIKAFLYDFARNQNFNIDNIKFVIDTLAEFGYNMMLINLEYRFDFPSCQGLAPPHSITPENALEIVNYGKDKNIEVVPQVNLIGHCEGITAIERYSHLSCDPYQTGSGTASEQLNLELPESRDIIGKMLDDICAAFPGQYLHIGLDEVRRTQAICPEDTDQAEKILVKHFQYVLELACQTGRQIMMWGDMPVKKEGILPLIPKNVIICDWYYGPEGRKKTLEKYKNKGFQVLACPAVNTSWTFNLHPEISYKNINRMLYDAEELDLDGFILTTWEFGHGRGMGVIWPWVAMAGAIGNGKEIGDPEKFVAKFASEFYDVDGISFVRLYDILCTELEKILGIKTYEDGVKRKELSLLNKILFRGFIYNPFSVEKQPYGPSNSLWEPSPFACWLYLRRLLSNNGKIEQFENLAEEAGNLADQLRNQVKKNHNQLKALINQSKAFKVMVNNLNYLCRARDCYHQAALAQGEDSTIFAQELNKTADIMEGMYSEMKKLEEILIDDSSIYGQDDTELSWIKYQEKSLTEHLRALKQLDFYGDSLLEFGVFLKRPAGINQRVIHR